MEEKCPKCGADVMYYHDPEKTRVVCSKKCNGWKPIKVIERKKIISFMGEQYELSADLD